MTVVQFYHLTSTPLERALPKLLEKAYGSGLRALVVAESNERIAQLNQLLWTYNPDSFLPHGSDHDGHAEEQPIYLSTQQDAPNGAQMMVIINAATAQQPERFERIADMFDGSDAAALEAARRRWKHYREAGLAPTYMQQKEHGGWEQKTAA